MPAWTSSAWFLTGPTASGKSRLALSLAEELGAEIIALDSMTLYRRMDIGTAKPSKADQERVPHHLIDVIEPWESHTLDQYMQRAEQACAEILSRGKRPLFVGGTPLYLKACLRGMFDGPAPDQALRASLEDEVARHGSETMHERLKSVDPPAADRIAPADARRIIRAIEVFEQTGRPMSQWQQEFDQPARPLPAVACLVPERTDRRAAIDRRVIEMFDAGWVEEVRGLLAPGQRPLSKTASQAVGYQEIIEHLRGETSFPETIERIQTRTRQFSKRQMTWFRHLEELRPFPIARDLAQDDAAVASLRENLRDFFQSHPARG